MYNYVRLDSNNVVVGVSQLAGKIDDPNMMLVESSDISLLGATYNEESDEFVPAPPPEPVPQVPNSIEQLQAENAALMMQVAQLEAKNEQQAVDTASLLMELTMKGVL